MNTETVVIPHPGNLWHVENLASIPLLRAQGFTGPDASLAISLGEYGMAWRLLPDGEWLFVYSHPTIRGAFDRASIRPLDPKVEWDWVDWAEFLSYFGMEEAEWLALPFPRQVEDLFRYYGAENVFGGSYWEGFKIAGIESDDE